MFNRECLLTGTNHSSEKFSTRKDIFPSLSGSREGSCDAVGWATDGARHLQKKADCTISDQYYVYQIRSSATSMRKKVRLPKAGRSSELRKVECTKQKLVTFDNNI
jgi:hypothetical protein